MICPHCGNDTHQHVSQVKCKNKGCENFIIIRPQGSVSNYCGPCRKAHRTLYESRRMRKLRQEKKALLTTSGYQPGQNPATSMDPIHKMIGGRSNIALVKAADDVGMLKR